MFLWSIRTITTCVLGFALAACVLGPDPDDRQAEGSSGETGALLFVASERDAVEVTSSADLELGTGTNKALTIEGWIRIDAEIAGAVISKRWTLDPAQTDYMLWVQPGAGLVWATGSAEDACAWMVTDLPELHTWQHVAMTLESSGAEEGHKAFFLNGVLTEECDYTHKGPAHDDDLLIGAAERVLLFHGVHDHFSGAIDELHLNGAVLYRESFEPDAHLSPNETSIAFWDFVLDEASELPDLSGHGHNGKVFGAQSISALR
ncbi:MAG: hypothetical protein CMH56_06680 [Myxococcales bacterium]|nr:hypothetical protein [Myxococcales bacterium]